MPSQKVEPTLEIAWHLILRSRSRHKNRNESKDQKQIHALHTVYTLVLEKNHLLPSKRQADTPRSSQQIPCSEQRDLQIRHVLLGQLFYHPRPGERQRSEAGK